MLLFIGLAVALLVIMKTSLLAGRDVLKLVSLIELLFNFVVLFSWATVAAIDTAAIIPSRLITEMSCLFIVIFEPWMSYGIIKLTAPKLILLYMTIVEATIAAMNSYMYSGTF